ncbi:MAG: DUF3093 domain-containing protein [Angustibacter sp.]
MSRTATSPIPTHQERLTPSAAIWVIATALAASSGLVVLAVDRAAAAGLSAVAVLSTAWALRRTSPFVLVRDGWLRAGQARIPLHHLGRAVVLDSARMTQLRGPAGDARAFWCHRPWIPGGVVVEVVDPRDPVPYWLISSRKPDRLAAALTGAAHLPGRHRGQAHSRQTS